MLQRLLIQNYAIIDEIQIRFSQGLNIITGETGAGKSILMGALNLILGERADTGVLLNKDRKCIVEGVFSVDTKPAVKQFLVDNELDNETELVLRREIAVNGKTRSFINDTPATLQQLKQLASLLVDLHQQFDTLELGDTAFQREVLDALAGNQATLVRMREQYNSWREAATALKQLREQSASFHKETDYNQFLFDELNDLQLKENELEELEQELRLLNHAEDIRSALLKIGYELKESDRPLTGVLKQLVQELNSFATHHPKLPELIQRLQSAQIELADIAEESSSLSDAVQLDPQRVALINDKLAAAYKLQRKHGVSSTRELLEIQAGLEEKLRAVLHTDEAILAKEKETAQLVKEAASTAAALSAARKKQADPLIKNVNRLLAQVGMPNARIQVEVTDSDLQETGSDTVEFRFDANKSNRFEPLRKVASGGELSRLMLCIKSLVAQHIDLPTMIFDEIDTGISGEAARQVGLIMKELAGSRQIICITHQPQIAGKANAHFFVYKEIKGETIKTNIRLLDNDERITAIARMLSGEKPTAAALENARELIN
ncbi:MAG TPA: DNA repair protein RecN [Chitinophagaceae bacterium]